MIHHLLHGHPTFQLYSRIKRLHFFALLEVQVFFHFFTQIVLIWYCKQQKCDLVLKHVCLLHVHLLYFLSLVLMLVKSLPSLLVVPTLPLRPKLPCGIVGFFMKPSLVMTTNLPSDSLPSTLHYAPRSTINNDFYVTVVPKAGEMSTMSIFFYISMDESP